MSTLYNARKPQDGPHNASPEVVAVWKNILRQLEAVFSLLFEEELLVRKERDKVHKASKRTSVAREQTSHRQEQNK